MLGIAVNPASVQKNDLIAAKTQTVEDSKGNEIIKIIGQPIKVRSANFCPSQPEKFHLNGECYDTRFATVVIPQN